MVTAWSQRVVRFMIPALLFFVPLVFFPGVPEALDMPKQFVLVALSLVTVFAWLIGMIAQRELRMRGGVLPNILPGLFAALVVVSSVFSLTGNVSLVGYAAQQYTSLLTTIVLVALYYAIINSADEVVVKRGILAFGASAMISGGICALSLLNLFPFPWEFTQVTGFNTVGSLNAFAGVLVAATVMHMGLFLTNGDEDGAIVPRGIWGWVIGTQAAFIGAITVMLLAAIDHWTLWVALIAGLVFLCCTAFLEPRHFPSLQRFALPITLFIAACAFLFLASPLRLPLPVVATPSWESSWSVTTQTLGELWWRAVIGTGPGSFGLDYDAFKPLAVNQTAFWDYRFEQAVIYPLTLVATLGVAGLLLWLLMVKVVTFSALHRLAKYRYEFAWKVYYALVAGWVVLLVLLLVAPVNIVSVSAFWIFAGLVMTGASQKMRTYDFSRSPRMALLVISGFAVLSVAGMLTVFVLGMQQSAAMAFARAMRLDADMTVPKIDVATQMQLAVSRDTTNATYRRNLAAAYLAYGLEYLESAAQDEMTLEEKQKFHGILQAAEVSILQASKLGPNDVANWSAGGLVYERLMPFYENAEDKAATYYARAHELEPVNPKHLVALGRVYLAVADRAVDVQGSEEVSDELKASAVANEAEMLRLAEEALREAVELKPNYAPAHYYLAAALERKGELPEAVQRLSALASLLPQDAGLGFQLGVLYLKQENTERAKAEFERVLGVYPDYSNAMWYLAAILAEEGDTEQAQQLLERVLELNPQHETVMNALNDIKNGEAIPENPVPLEGVVEGEISAVESL